jgi:hypothetical protein
MRDGGTGEGTDGKLSEGSQGGRFKGSRFQTEEEGEVDERGGARRNRRRKTVPRNYPRFRNWKGAVQMHAKEEVKEVEERGGWSEPTANSLEEEDEFTSFLEESTVRRGGGGMEKGARGEAWDDKGGATSGTEGGGGSRNAEEGGSGGGGQRVGAPWSWSDGSFRVTDREAWRGHIARRNGESMPPGEPWMEPGWMESNGGGSGGGGGGGGGEGGSEGGKPATVENGVADAEGGGATKGATKGGASAGGNDMAAARERVWEAQLRAYMEAGEKHFKSLK